MPRRKSFQRPAGTRLACSALACIDLLIAEPCAAMMACLVRCSVKWGAAVDGRALRQVLELRPDLLLLGICAIDADDGVEAFHSEDAQMKRALLERSGSVAIAVLNDKLSASAPFQVAGVDVVGDLVVEADAPKQVVLDFESLGIRIHRAKILSAKSEAELL